MFLSIIMAARNDDYGNQVYREGFEPAIPTSQKDRIQASLFTIHEAFKDLDYEVVFVEWNPPSDREKIRDWDFMKHPRIRIFEVPSEISKNVIGDLSFHEFHAKNAGIRRARGFYILCTNPDILWLHPMKDALNSSFLSIPSISYRWTVYTDVLKLGLNIDKIKDYCFNDNNRIDYDLHSNGDFLLMHSGMWFDLKGYSTPKDLAMIAGVDMQQARRAAQRAGDLYILPFPIYHLRHPGPQRRSCIQEQVEVSDGWGLKNYKI